MTTGEIQVEEAEQGPQCDIGVEETPTEENSDIDVEESVAVPFQDILDRLKPDARAELLLALFEERFNIASSIEAFVQIPIFLGDYMVREFDYRKFCIDCGSIDDASAEDDGLWTAHMSQHLTADLVSASSLMLRLAVTIAKVHGLETSDWQDVNEACSNALRSLPACYRLQRALPGALSTARAWRHLPNGPEDVTTNGSVNPWSSEENQVTFEDMFHFPWVRTDAICADDKEVVGAFSGRFEVVEVATFDGISLVSLKANRIGIAPEGFPWKPTAQGDVVLWEVESALGSLIQEGFFIEGDFYELQSNTCFLSNMTAISPAWVP